LFKVCCTDVASSRLVFKASCCAYGIWSGLSMVVVNVLALAKAVL
jgi:hypothetical protein